jgi:hypothetical protein
LAGHDRAKLKKMETGKDTLYLTGKYGISGGPQDWKYTGGDGSVRLVTAFLTVRVRKGLDPITAIAKTPEELEAILPPPNPSFVPPKVDKYRSGTFESVEHLCKLLPDLAEQILEFITTDEGQKYVKSTLIVKPSRRSLDQRDQYSTKKAKQMLE